MHYLAYGSNLHPLRLRERVPSAHALGVVKLQGQLLNFHKRSKDASGKCSLCAVLGSFAYGVVYEFSPDHKAGLDAAEGLGHGYDESVVSVALDDTLYHPFVYLASPIYIDASLQPFHWYKSLVLCGARYHKLPSAYISKIESVRSIADQNNDRVMQHEALLARMEAV